MDVGLKAARKRPELTPARGIAAAQYVALAGAAALTAVTLGADTWNLARLLVIAAFTVASALIAVDSGTAREAVSGRFVGVILAAVLLGGGPAALVGALAIGAGWLCSRESAYRLRGHLVALAWFPLLVGLAFHADLSSTHTEPGTLSYYLLVLAAFVLGMALQSLLLGGLRCLADGSSRWREVRTSSSLSAAKLFAAALTIGGAYVVFRLGIVGIAAFAVACVIFEHLACSLLKSQRRGEELQRIVSTDELTGLANRERFRAALEERIAACKKSGQRFTVMLVDLDRFKEINDTLGHHYGDVLLRQLGPRLVQAVGDGGLVARLGGDEFAALLAPGSGETASTEQVAARLAGCVKQPFAVDELALEVGASIGVAGFPGDGEDSYRLLRCADIAMYAAKEAQCDFKLYTREQSKSSAPRLSVLGEIGQAISSQELVVHYQPIIDLSELTVSGAEALVRWQHPELGLLPANAFVQTVGQAGAIGLLTRHVLEQSIAQCASWRRDGRELSISVNLSPRNLADRDLPEELERLLAGYSLPPQALVLEITESMIMSDPQRAMATATRLSDLGVRIAVDDFGTGYSSLATLHRLPIDELKIDRSLVSPMLDGDNDLIIVRSTINLGHDLGLRVIAEGVEDGPTLQSLALLECDLAQGHHLGRPMPSQAFKQWLGSATSLAVEGKLDLPSPVIDDRRSAPLAALSEATARAA